MNDSDYMKEALKSMEEAFALDMPVMQAVPDTDVSVEEIEKNVDTALEYQKYFDGCREYEDCIAGEAGFSNRRKGIVHLIEADLSYRDAFASTFFDKYEAKIVAVDPTLRMFPRLFRERVILHELGHVYGEGLGKPCRNLEQAEAVMVAESVPEHAMRRAFEKASKKKNDGPDKMARLIKATTPYRESVIFGELADEIYEGGYSGLMSDIRKHGGRCAMDSFYEAVRERTGQRFTELLERRSSYKKAA